MRGAQITVYAVHFYEGGRHVGALGDSLSKTAAVEYALAYNRGAERGLRRAEVGVHIVRVDAPKLEA